MSNFLFFNNTLSKNLFAYNYSLSNFVVKMRKENFKYLLSLCITLLCINFLFYTAGANYIIRDLISINNSTQNGPQKRFFNSNHNLIVKFQSESNDQDGENEGEDSEQSENEIFQVESFNFYSHFLASYSFLNNLKTLNDDVLPSRSHINYYSSLDALYIAFRVFRL